MALLEIRDLVISAGETEIASVDMLTLNDGERLGLVGESGAGKTMLAMSLIGLQPRGVTVSGSVKLGGHQLVGINDRQLSRLCGTLAGVVFQDASRALNPTMRVGRQIAEAIRLHRRASRAATQARVLELLDQVGLGTHGAEIARRYPHQISGGQRQRVMIAIAIACSPQLLIADEPTTALDVTVQEGILKLLEDLSRQKGMAMVFVSHDLGVVQTVVESVAVMYGGRVVEYGPASGIVSQPRHRYAEALVGASLPGVNSAKFDSLRDAPLLTIPGVVPPLGRFPSGCRFRDRCAFASDECANEPKRSWDDQHTHYHRCWHPTEVEAARV